VRVQFYETDKVCYGLFLLEWPMITIMALCDPDSSSSLVIYASTILVYLTWLDKVIRVPCVCPIVLGR
jgi:hypothetical protein